MDIDVNKDTNTDNDIIETFFVRNDDQQHFFFTWPYWFREDILKDLTGISFHH